MSTPDPAQEAAEARVRFLALAARFRHARAEAWSEWVTSRIEQIVVAGFEVTNELSDDTLGSIKHLAGMVIVGQSAHVAAEPLEALEPARWEGELSFDARSARGEFDTNWRELPGELERSLRSAGYDTSILDATRERSASRRDYEHSITAMVAATGELVAAAARQHAAVVAQSRRAAKERWRVA